ncbi:MAG: hypothetical protein IPO60_06795 [Flavobacteriales bacterium]|jgi:hypothetical protein|nr:hypothetical protein [Flavobacteriales bacterium]MBK6894268.1 hypothetical protein [Flavobacteriales bacterium]MBK7248198.1 hypothetical protein [Flavobacteriales bacterium]MBK7287453.1 hypothetical protein [Flavobacteriales bacterium]MBK9059616.1 hypothetical protein [Flavobacteriales bacterium]
MKTPSVALASVVLLIMATTGCSKEAAVPPDAVEVINTLKQDNGPKIVDTWHDNGNPSGVEGTDYGCWGDPTDCYEPIVVTPPVLALNVAFDAISTGNDSIIAGTFDTYASELSKYMRGSDVDDVINGSASASARMGEKHRYMIIGTKGKKPVVISTYPVKK